jgi:hypothetical protein
MSGGDPRQRQADAKIWKEGGIHSGRGNSPQDCGREDFSVHLLSRYAKKESSILSQPKGQNVMFFPSILDSHPERGGRHEHQSGKQDEANAPRAINVTGILLS